MSAGGHHTRAARAGDGAGEPAEWRAPVHEHVLQDPPRGDRTVDGPIREGPAPHASLNCASVIEMAVAECITRERQQTTISTS